MKKHISYPKIGQFRNVISAIIQQSSFIGLDENGEAIYNNALKKPVIKFNGTVKLHGTNASVCFNSNDGFWVQSRKNVITPIKDNAGFAFFAEPRKEDFMILIESVSHKYGIDLNEFTISLYGEWAGKGIQKSVAISKIEKSFFLFGVKVSKPNDPEFTSYWVEFDYMDFDYERIYKITNFKTYEVEVDFNMPQLSQNKIVEITEQVEEECPVAKHFGFSGLGEGVVWSATYNGISYRFKSKGEKHSASKVKKLASVDTEKLNSIKEFVKYSVTQNRFDQAIKEVFGNKEVVVQKMGDFLRWIINDIREEESDTMVANKLEPKDVNKHISFEARRMFFEFQNNKVGL